MESSAVAAGHKSGSVGETSYSHGRRLSRPTTKRRSGIVWEASLFIRTAPEPSDDGPQVSFSCCLMEYVDKKIVENFPQF
jgi:hypothetical protein